MTKARAAEATAATSIYICCSFRRITYRSQHNSNKKYFNINQTKIGQGFEKQESCDTFRTTAVVVGTGLASALACKVALASTILASTLDAADPFFPQGH